MTTKIELLKEAIAKKNSQIDVLKYMLTQIERERDVLVWDLSGDEVRKARADKKVLKEEPKEEKNNGS